MRDRYAADAATVVVALCLLLLYLSWRSTYVALRELTRLHTSHQGTAVGKRISRLSLAWLCLCAGLALLAVLTELTQPFGLIAAIATLAWLVALELLDRQEPGYLGMPGDLLAPWRGTRKAA